MSMLQHLNCVLIFHPAAARAAAPGEPPFCKEGDRVKKGQTVCIIEAMKLMNEIEVGLGAWVCNRCCSSAFAGTRLMFGGHEAQQ